MQGAPLRIHEATVPDPKGVEGGQLHVDLELTPSVCFDTKALRLTVKHLDEHPQVLRTGPPGNKGLPFAIVFHLNSVKEGDNGVIAEEHARVAE